MLSTIVKVTEKVLLLKLEKEIKNKQKLQNCHFGFKQKHNTVQQVARIVTDIKLSFNKNQNTIMLLLDPEKSFDSVWTTGVTYKAIKSDFNINLIHTINSYLTNRKFKVKVGEALLKTKNIMAGVP